MRDWLLKPLLIVLAIVVVLGVVSLWWLSAGPSRAGAADRAAPSAYQQRLERVLRDLEDGY
jgi:hypothetical protein